VRRWSRLQPRRARARPRAQARPLARVLRRDEGLEQLLADARRDARTVVVDLEDDGVAVASRAQLDPPTLAVHGVGRVEHEVQQHLLEPLLRERDRRQIWLDRACHLHAAHTLLGGEQPEHGVDHGLDVRRARALAERLARPREIEQIA
jgi:hypothetical protein